MTSIPPEKTHFKTFSISGQTDVVANSESDTLTLKEGSNITLTTEDNTITIAASGGGGSTNAFSTIAVSGSDNIEADSSTDTLTFAAGSGISIANNAGTDTVTITSTTYTAGDGLDLTGTAFSTDLKASGGLVIESTELAVDLGAESITGTLAISDGGTGATTLTDGGILLGGGTGPITAMGVLADSHMIVGDGTTAPVAETGAILRTSIGVGTGDNVQFNSLGVGTAATGTTGEIRAINDITAFYSSDKRLKTNIQPIQDPLTKLQKIGGYTFDWIPKEGIHSHTGNDIGVIAQEIEEVLPEVTTTRDNGYKAVRYEKLTAYLIECVKAQQTHIQQLEDRLVKLEKKD